MTVWSLVTDSGFYVSLYLTEVQAYEALGRDFLTGEFLDDYSGVLASKGIDAAKDWITEYFEETGEIGSYTVTKHEHPWVFPAKEGK